MLTKSIKILLLLAILLVIAYGSITMYANCVSFQDDGLPDVPDIKDAKYSFRIMNTGNTLYTSNYEHGGDAIGDSVFTLHGYWEMVKDKYKYRKGDITLDEKTFGPIRVLRR